MHFDEINIAKYFTFTFFFLNGDLPPTCGWHKLRICRSHNLTDFNAYKGKIY